MKVQTSPRVWIAAAVLLAVILVCLASVFAWREHSRPTDTSKYTVTNLRLRYPGYFRTPAEQETYQRQFFSRFNNPQPVQRFAKPNNNSSCSFQCTRYPQRLRRSRSQSVFHGCCESYAEFIDPTELPNLSNISRRIVQLEGNNQYFLQHVCMTVLNCNGCQCAQEQSLVTGVVVKFGVTEPEEIDDVEIDFFLLDGCCRCINV